jgi:hypothetical protein
MAMRRLPLEVANSQSLSRRRVASSAQRVRFLVPFAQRLRKAARRRVRAG